MTALVEPIADFFTNAEAATWQVGTATTAVSVIFGNAHVPVPVGSISLSSTEPWALAQISEMPTAAVGQTLTIRGTVYTIRDVEPDVAGLIYRFPLEKP